ncbi:hypothetical protein RB195_000293 [Necator americanus]|uniref:Reverse transcriptase domain-containing protein n=1 Tax=Necator americanus TaxID=51031 RepID=A0ABR1D9R5_NECAM
MLLKHFRRARLEKECAIEPFDDASFCSNVSNSATMQAAFEVLVEHRDSEPVRLFHKTEYALGLMLEVLHIPLVGKLLRTDKGFGHGMKTCSYISHCVHVQLEKPILKRKSSLHYRHVDDYCIICATQEGMDTCFEPLDNHSPYIRFRGRNPKKIGCA